MCLPVLAAQANALIVTSGSAVGGSIRLVRDGEPPREAVGVPPADRPAGRHRGMRLGALADERPAATDKPPALG
ncbi:hypothetical protein ASF41_10825 [Methylobacterium sp. Leaf111]|nr:hypothetical protein ASF41_10825 [Methylobacterium sp. Leaf111]